jgi:hypothetical protein
MGFVGLLQALVLSSLGALNSFFWHEKKVSKEKARPASPSMAKSAVNVTLGILLLGLKAALTGVQNSYPAVLSCALHK